MGVIQNSLEVVKLAGRIANPELLERVTSLNEQVLELSSRNVELQERLFQLERNCDTRMKSSLSSDRFSAGMGSSTTKMNQTPAVLIALILRKS